MRKLLSTKLAVLGLIVAAPALAAGTAATVGSLNDSGSGDEPPVVHFTTDHSTLLPDLQDEVTDVEDQPDPGPAAESPDNGNDDQASDDQAEPSQPTASDDDQGENDDDQGEDADNQGDDDQGDQAVSEDDQGGSQADDQGDSNDQSDSSGDGQDDGGGDN